MKKLVLTMASLVMLASMAFAQETPMLPESHGLTANQPAWGGSQTFSLAAGWNWWSTYINTNDISLLEDALNGNADMIKIGNEYAQYSASSQTWNGDLSSISNSSMYAIQMNTAYEFTLRGSRANISSTPINLTEGWNWVGYPVSFELPVVEALSGYENPIEGEIYKSNTQMVTYYNGAWVGDLDMQTVPGVGYKMLKTQQSATFYYPSTSGAKNRELVSSTPRSTEWQPVMSSTPTNMNMIAIVNLDNLELSNQDVEIGVFNDETCRGAKHLTYVESENRYYLFMTMYGENDEPFRFRLLDHETGDVYESNEVSVNYKADAVIGSMAKPFELNFSTKNSMFAGALNLFPNPVNRGEMVNLTLPADGTVEVINVLGSTMKRVRMAEGSQLAADMAPGIYTIKVTDAEGNVYVDKLVVK